LSIGIKLINLSMWIWHNFLKIRPKTFVEPVKAVALDFCDELFDPLDRSTNQV
jgi:hypothetical protein